MELREQGWMRALRQAGLPDGPIVRTDFTRRGGYEAGIRMFADETGPRAVFVSSDMQAIGVMRALWELGLRVPEDVAIVSFDGAAEADYTNPQLTTVRRGRPGTRPRRRQPVAPRPGPRRAGPRRELRVRRASLTHPPTVWRRGAGPPRASCPSAGRVSDAFLALGLLAQEDTVQQLDEHHQP